MTAAIPAPSMDKRLATRQDVRWLVLLAAGLLVVLSVNPLGFIGGGWDDWQYLNAARCWREHGPCLPLDHWQARWPIIAPVALVTWLFGETRVTVGLAPLLASSACLYLLSRIGNRLFGPPVGWLAAMLFLVTPAFSIQLLDIAVEATELALILAGFLAVTHWLARNDWRTAIVAGLCFGLALQLRETSLIALALTGAYMFVARGRFPAGWPWFVAAFALPLLLEFATFAVETGDPLFRRTLSVRHTLIPSSELLHPVSSRAPFFNPAYIANWKHEPGVHVHWTVDGLVNLFVNAKAGVSLGAVLLLLLAAPGLSRSDRRPAAALFALALLYAAILIYAFAIDPKARMMFVPLAMACTALALLLVELWVIGKRLLGACIIVAHASAGLLILYGHQRTDILEEPAAAWIAAHPGQVEIDENTRRHLALVKGAEALAPLDGSKRYLIYNSNIPCGAWLELSGLSGNTMTVVGEAKISRLGWLDPKLSGALCFYRYEKPMSGEQIRAAIRRSRYDAQAMVGSRKL